MNETIKMHVQFGILKFEDIQSKQSKISQNGNNFVHKMRVLFATLMSWCQQQDVGANIISLDKQKISALNHKYFLTRNFSICLWCSKEPSH